MRRKDLNELSIELFVQQRTHFMADPRHSFLRHLAGDGRDKIRAAIAAEGFAGKVGIAVDGGSASALPAARRLRVGSAAPRRLRVERLGIENVKANDGPQGFRGPAGTSTAWPSGLAIAATFDVDAAHSWGKAQGKEFYDKVVEKSVSHNLKCDLLKACLS